jgi:DNA polymerase III delta prime subunit
MAAPQTWVTSMDEEGQAETPSPFTVVTIPNSCMECGPDEPAVFHSLIYKDNLPTKLLHYTLNMIKFTAIANLNAFQGGWYHSILLHGPPGSGKTTLCRALANHLAIRLDSAHTGKLITIQAQSLISKYFGESGTLVEQAFRSIMGIASDSTGLVCVIIDEVESLMTSREKSVARNEVSDVIRVTNQLLTAIDRLREFPNIIMFFTSNLLSSLVSCRASNAVPPSPSSVEYSSLNHMDRTVHSSIVWMRATSLTIHPMKQRMRFSEPAFCGLSPTASFE